MLSVIRRIKDRFIAGMMVEDILDAKKLAKINAAKVWSTLHMGRGKRTKGKASYNTIIEGLRD